METTRAWPTGQSCSAQQAAPGKSVNVGDVERVASILIGGGLTLGGLRRLDSLAGIAAAIFGSGLIYRGISGHCATYKMLGVSTRGQGAVHAGRGSRIERSILVSAAPEEVYRFWRQLENLPRFFNHIKLVRSHEGTRSHWMAEGPLGVTAEWEAEIINDKPNQLIAWRSLPGGQVDTAGSVHFDRDHDGHGTRVHVELKYDPPGGQVGILLAHLLGESPEQQLAADLFRLKRILEAGETAALDQQPVSQAHQAMQSSACTGPDCNPKDRIEEASDESFPASDPPGWTTSAATTNHRRN